MENYIGNHQDKNQDINQGNTQCYLALMIGNSRLHWAYVKHNKIIQSWDTNYFSKSKIKDLANCDTIEDFSLENKRNILTASSPLSPPPIILASVVPKQTQLWKNYPNLKIITLEQIPLKNTYPSLGIDRVLAMYGAINTFNTSVLVIDAGTALTISGGDNNYKFIGGAILPGLGLQLATLNQRTGKLPQVESPQVLPQKYALNTEEAIQSGVIYTMLAGMKEFIQDWSYSFPESKIIITGGDRISLSEYFKYYQPDIYRHLRVEANLIFWGMKIVKKYLEF